jgi:hypothetical protein
MISQEVMSPLNMSHLFVKDWIFGYWDSIGVITHEGALSKLTPKSLKVCIIQRTCEQQLAAATYSASVVDCVTEDCFREDQQMREDPRKWQVPEVLFRSIPHPAESASEKPTRSNEEEAEYQISNSRVCLRYLKTLMWRAWERLKARAQPHGELNVRPCRCEVQEGVDHAPVLSLWSTASQSSSGPSEATELIRVDTGLSSTMLNFFIRSFVYSAWCTKVPCFVCFTWIHKKKVSSPIMDI